MLELLNEIQLPELLASLAVYAGLIPLIENFVNKLKGDKEEPTNVLQKFVREYAALVAAILGVGLVTLLSGGDYRVGLTFGVIVGGGSSLFYEYKHKGDVVVVEAPEGEGDGKLQ